MNLSLSLAFLGNPTFLQNIAVIMYMLFSSGLPENLLFQVSLAQSDQRVDTYYGSDSTLGHINVNPEYLHWH